MDVKLAGVFPFAGVAMIQERRPSALAIVAGVALGFLVVAATLGLPNVFPTHLECTLGPILGTSERLAAPYYLAVSPPGGFVNLSFAQEVNGSTTYFGSEDQPSNGTVVDISVTSWNLQAVVASKVAGPGAQVTCRSTYLSESGGVQDSYAGYQLLPPVGPGIDTQTTVPSQVTYDGYPSVSLNETYPASPVAAFSWKTVGGHASWTNLSGWQNITSSLKSIKQNGSYFGLAIPFTYNATRFGIPINLLAGGTETVAGGYPNPTSSGVTWRFHMVYILPTSDDEGTWNVYLPDGGAPYSSGGLLFEQVA